MERSDPHRRERQGPRRPAGRAAERPVVVPFESLNGTISAFRSDNGGASWSRAVKVSGIRFHGVAGDLRTSPLPTPRSQATGRSTSHGRTAASGKKCASNDIVFSKSSDGVTWTIWPACRSTPSRAASTTSSPAWPSTRRPPARDAPGADLLLLSQRQLRRRVQARRRLHLVSRRRRALGRRDPARRADGAGQIANTSQGPMTGDYISTSFSGGRARRSSRSAATRRRPRSTRPCTPRPPVGRDPRQATHAASSAGPFGAVGTGETHHALKND